MGRRQYSHASSARRRTTSRTSGLCGSCTARRRSAAKRCLRPGCRSGGVIALGSTGLVAVAGAALANGPCPLPLPGLVHPRLRSRLVGLRLPPPGEGALDICEDLRPHLLHGDAALRRELVNAPLVRRSRPRGDERVQLDLLLLSKGAPVLKVEELREAAALLRSEDVVSFRGVIRISCVLSAKGNGVDGEQVVQPDVQH